MLIAHSRDELLSKNANVLLKELSRQSEALASQVVEGNGVSGFLENIRLFEGASRTSAVMGLGFLAASSESIAMTVIEAGSVPLLRDILVQESDQNTLVRFHLSLSQSLS